MQGIQVVETGLQKYPKDRRLEQNLRSAYIDQIQIAVRNSQFKKATEAITKAKCSFTQDIVDLLRCWRLLCHRRVMGLGSRAQ